MSFKLLSYLNFPPAQDIFLSQLGFYFKFIILISQNLGIKHEKNFPLNFWLNLLNHKALKINMAFFKANILDESNVFSIGLASKRETRKTACSIWNDGLWPRCTSINMLVWYYQHYKEQDGWKISLQTTTDLSQAYSLPIFNFSLNGTIKLPLFFCFPHGFTTRSLIIPVLLSGIWVF